MTIRLISGTFATGFKEEVIHGVKDPGMEFREFVDEIARDLGFTEDEIDEQLSLLLNMRLEARRRREAQQVLCYSQPSR